MTPQEAAVLYAGNLARQGKSPRTIDGYRRLLVNFAALLEDDSVTDVAGITIEHYERFLDRWVGKSPSTLATAVSLMTGYSRFLFERGLTDRDVAYVLKRPRRKPADELDVVTISPLDAGSMIATCEDWQELLCIASACYLGPRRAALARARRGDVDLRVGTIRFVEKGSKVIVKPMPNEYVAILRAAEEHGIWKSPEDYLIPNRRPASVRRRERSDKIIWNTVKRVAARAGIRCHVHALRAAFAVAYDEAHPGELMTLKDLMGHSRIETTAVYLRRRDKRRAMESVRDLSFGVVNTKAHTGFEPVPESPVGPLSGLPVGLLEQLDELRDQRRAKVSRA